MDMASGDCFELNRLGAEIRARLGQGESPRNWLPALATSYGLPAATVESDVRTLLEELTRSGLLTPSSP